MNLKTNSSFLLVVFLAFRAWGIPALTDDELAHIQFDPKINSQISPALTFEDENGKRVHLTDYPDGRPMVLILGYYGCPMLCTLVLNGATECFRDLSWQAGDQFEVVFVSIDPAETPTLAKAKKASYEHAYGNVHADTWHFLVGDAASISNLADEIGFRYAYDNNAKQFAHPSGFVVLTPAARVARYFYGINFSAKEVDDALRNAAGGRTQPVTAEEQFSLLCFHYAPVHGKYGNLVMTIVRSGGIVTLIGLASLITTQSIRARKGRPK